MTTQLPAYFDGVARTVTTAGTQVQLSTTSKPSYEVQIVANPANTGLIYYGDSSVSSTDGPALNAGDGVTIPINDVAAIWIDSSVNGEGVIYTYTAPANPVIQSPLYGG